MCIVVCVCVQFVSVSVGGSLSRIYIYRRLVGPLNGMSYICV